jgi:ferredoxin-NADP reductase
MLLMAAGIGITPMRALIEDTPYAPGEATLIYRYGAEEHAVFADELREIATHRGVELILLPGPRRADTSWQPAGSAHGDGTPWQSDGPVHLASASWQTTSSAHGADTARQAAAPAHFADTSGRATGSARLDNDAQALRNLVPDIAQRDVYVCGPPAWITAVRKAARGAGAHRDSIHTEEFAW